MPAQPSSHPALTWRKSSASGAGECVEVACSAASVLVRDSSAPPGAMLAFTSEQWSAFLRRIRNEG